MTQGAKDTSKEKEWQFSGKIMSHEVEITGIAFGKKIDENDQVLVRLFSVGSDRKCFEYDVKEAKLNTELPVLFCFPIEIEARPTSCIWYPGTDSKEGILLTTNDEYKIKLWNPTTETARRTCLGPTYGGEITKLKSINMPRGDKYLVYATNKKVIGLI